MIQFINENFLKFLALTQVSMGVIITSAHPAGHMPVNIAP